MANNRSPSLAVIKSFLAELGFSEIDFNTITQAVVAAGNINEAEGLIQISCLALRLKFQDIVYLPGNEKYEAKMGINWSKTSHLPAACVFSPSRPEEVSVGVKIATFFNTPFAIRSGGHTPNPGAASSDGGILFSLEGLNEIVLDSSREFVRIGSGNRWRDVYAALEPDGLAVVGGRVPPVGVAGLITGAGNSYFSGTYGLACDNIKSLQIVLANGTITTASPSSNPDLLWAVKGGANNFGIVTSFDLYTIPIPSGVWGGALAYLSLKSTQLTAALEVFQKEGQIQDPSACVISTARKVDGADMFLITMSHTSHAERDPKVALKPFLELEATTGEAGVKSLRELCVEAYGGLSDDAILKRRDFRTVSIGVSAELYDYAQESFSDTFATLKHIPGFDYSLTYQPISVVMVDEGIKKGGNPLGLKRQPQTWLCLTSAWDNPTDDTTILKAAKELIEKVRVKSVEMGLGVDYLFLNDASTDQEVMKSYGEENCAKLKMISQKFDPDGVFQKLVTGGHKLRF